jgi:myo-inositol 2-dehydrogenase/D-chiro-inositol 1-dehydrogenase
MKFALLGAEPDILPLLAAIRGSVQHTLVAAYETSAAQELDLNSFGVSEIDDEWESLLLGSLADAVIVCRCQNQDRRADQLRKLTQAAIPLIIVHPVGEAILAFELQMIQQDSGGLIVPYQPDLDHPVFKELCDNKANSGEIPVGQVSVERRLAAGAAADVRRQFARDALIIRQIVGRIDQVSALGAGQELTDYASLSVQMSAENGGIARWVVLPANEGGTTLWTVHSPDGTTTASLQDNGDWTITRPDSVTKRGTVEASHVAALTLDRLAGRQAGRRMPGADWDDACRSVELLENVDISKRRGKTIQLHYEDISEENTFKSLMTAGGCLILILLVVLLPTLATVETLLRPAGKRTEVADASDQTSGQPQTSSSSPFLQTEPKNIQAWDWFGTWPLLLLGFLTFFICLQFLRLITKSAKSRGGQSSPPSSSE